ncbi:hypothetical protein [Halomonas sp. NO4]|uniref:hypothetical protein n=1 Tax=Halomonas sp. NO4 TaxID=2484813 RepID=UPI0013D7BC78|nr:hypothetical protein [Halomonas sp. NO4]
MGDNGVVELAEWYPSLATGEEPMGEPVSMHEQIADIVSHHADDLLGECMEAEALTLCEAVNELSVVTEYQNDGEGSLIATIVVWRLSEGEQIGRRDLRLNFQ